MYLVKCLYCVPGQIMYNCSYIGAMFFWDPCLIPPPPSSLYPGQHHAYCKTLVALEDGQVVIKCHQHHQLLFKICYLYVTNVYSYVLMMQIKFVLYCKFCKFVELRFTNIYVYLLLILMFYWKLVYFYCVRPTAWNNIFWLFRFGIYILQ